MQKPISPKSWACLLALLLLTPAVQAVEQETQQQAGVSPGVEEILTREPDAEDYSAEERCVQTRRIRRTEVLDERHIALHMGRDEYYIIQFEHRCAGLRPKQAVIFETTMSNRLCSMDAIRPTYNMGTGGMSPGARCSVPGFQPVTKDQVVMLKDTLKVQAREAREARKAAKQAAKEAKQQEKALRKAAEAAERDS